MRAIDTNVVLRLLVGDDDVQVAAAEKFIRDGAWLPILALAEAAWSLRSVYKRNPGEIAAAIEMLLDNEMISIEHSNAAKNALRLFRLSPALGFSDCLMLEMARAAGHLPLGTFDGRLAKAESAFKI